MLLFNKHKTDKHQNQTPACDSFLDHTVERTGNRCTISFCLFIISIVVARCFSRLYRQTVTLTNVVQYWNWEFKILWFTNHGTCFTWNPLGSDCPRIYLEDGWQQYWQYEPQDNVLLTLPMLPNHFLTRQLQVEQGCFMTTLFFKVLKSHNLSSFANITV